jgi:chemotaxis protein histidine kinase CheA
MDTGNTRQQTYQATLENVRRNFMNSLESYLSELEGYIELMNDSERTLESLEGIRTRAHKIRGIAATLGFESLGEAAGMLESVIVKMTSNKSANPSETAKEFVGCYQRLVSGLSKSIEAKLNQKDA